jgi:hypothetical protein
MATILYLYDIDTSSYKSEHQTPLRGAPIGEVAERVANYIGDVPALNSLRDVVLRSLVQEDSNGDVPELKMGAYRAIQLLSINGCDHLVRHMFASNTEGFSATQLPNVVKISSLIEDEGSYYVLYERAKSLLSKSGYYNKFQVHMHENMDVDHTGIPSLLKLIALLLLYMDVN